VYFRAAHILGGKKCLLQKVRYSGSGYFETGRKAKNQPVLEGEEVG